MANWLTPRILANSSEVKKRLHPDQLFAPHVYPLNNLVEKINKSEYGDNTVPWFDPFGAGINAKVLFLLQDPSNAALGTGFISPDNPDKTADYTSYFRNKANLLPKELVHWNIIPWEIKNRNLKTELLKAKPFFIEFLSELKNLQVVVCMGKYAEFGWNYIYPEKPCSPGWKKMLILAGDSIISLNCPLTSPQSINGYHPLVDGLNPSERIEKTLKNVRLILDRKSSKND